MYVKFEDVFNAVRYVIPKGEIGKGKISKENFGLWFEKVNIYICLF